MLRDRRLRLASTNGTPRSEPRKPIPIGYQREGRVRGVPMPPHPLDPLPFDDKDISDVRACCAGTASPEQAKRAMDAVLAWARTYEEVMHPDPHLHAYMTGSRRVGLMIIQMVNSRTRNQDDSEHG